MNVDAYQLWLKYRRMITFDKIVIVSVLAHYESFESDAMHIHWLTNLPILETGGIQHIQITDFTLKQFDTEGIGYQIVNKIEESNNE